MVRLTIEQLMDVAGINCTTAVPTTVAMEALVKKLRTKTPAVERAVTTRTLIFAAKET